MSRVHIDIDIDFDDGIFAEAGTTLDEVLERCRGYFADVPQASGEVVDELMAQLGDHLQNVSASIQQVG